MQDSKTKTETRRPAGIFFLLGLLGGSLVSLLFLVLLGSKTSHENVSFAGTLLVPSARADVPAGSADSAGSSGSAADIGGCTPDADCSSSASSCGNGDSVSCGDDGAI